MTAKDCFVVQPGGPLKGSTSVPGDKSISHRAVMFGALAQGQTHVRAWLPAGDTEASLASVMKLGIKVERHNKYEMTIHGGEFQKPDGPLNLVNAGTGIRLIAGIMCGQPFAGIMCGQPFASILDGSEQLRRRPMKRIVAPLQQMGANITATNDRAPLNIVPAQMHGIRYDMPVASAQVKSAILLAGLYAEGETIVTQPGPARDHTERMLSAMGADIHTDGHLVAIRPKWPLQPMNLTVPGDISSATVPGDISSAAFVIVAGLLVPGSDLTLTGINLNPTRTGLLDVLRQMGADLIVEETGLEAGEPLAWKLASLWVRFAYVIVL